MSSDAARAGAAMRRDLAAAYVASLAKIGSWVIVSALVYRGIGAAEFAMLALIRGTIGLLNYTSFGLAPALIHQAASADGQSRSEEAFPDVHEPTPQLMHYEARRKPNPALSLLYANALSILGVLALAALALTAAYAVFFERLFRVPAGIKSIPAIVLLMGLGTVLRLAGDVSGAVLQVRSRIALDNLWVAMGDAAWVVLTALAVATRSSNAFLMTAVWYAVSGLVAYLARRRSAASEVEIGGSIFSHFRRKVAGGLLLYGALVTAAQFADYLYAPMDYILINRLMSPLDVADYAPAVQIDAGLLVLVSGLAAVLLPKAALAHSAGSRRTVRRYYVRGTLASLAVLCVAAVAVWWASPWLFRIWLGKPMTATQAILPLLLTHTVVGGSSAVGRSILLAVGKVRPFTVAVLIAGAVNVACSYTFVRYFHWGLKGIVLGTIVAVVGRCAVWMPLYVLWELRGGVPGSAGRVSG